MKKSVFVTGIAGSGKSTVCLELKNLGFESYDIEDDKHGLFTFIRKDTGEWFEDYDNTDPIKTKNAKWVCDLLKLKKLINNQTTEIAFYCGVASDNEKLMPIFNVSILLEASKEELNKRLMVREGTDNYANTKQGRERVLQRKDEFEGRMKQVGMIVVSANNDSTNVAEEIIKMTIV